MSLFNLAPRASDQLKLLQAEMVFKGTPRTLTLGVLAVWIIAISVWDGARSVGYRLDIAGWGIAQTLVLLRGVRLARKFQSQPRRADEIDRWSRLLVQNGFLAALLWGGASLILLPASSFEREAVVMVAIAMIILAGAQTVYLPVVQAFVLTTCAVFAGGLFVIGDALHNYVGIAFLLFGVVIVLFGRNQDHVVRRAIQLSLEKEELLTERIAKQHEAESAKREAEKARAEAERANLSKTRFFAAASHDLRQPLHALGFYVAHLAKLSHDPEEAKTIERLQAATRAMEELLSAVLAYSRLSPGKETVSIADFPLDPLLQQLDVQLRPAAVQKGIGLDLRPCGLSVRSDPLLLGRILRNIASNAVRYTDRGAIGIRACRRRGSVRVRIYDTGPGIPRQERERIFEEFYQLGNAERSREKGLGLGLAIVRQLADLLSLRVVLHSKVGRGSVFSVEVPEASRTAWAPREPAAATGLAQLAVGACVALVDDDPIVLDSMTVALNGFGCYVVSASSGKETVERLGAQDRVPNLIIADFRLTNGETGPDAIKTIRDAQRHDEPSYIEVPAILISGNAEMEELQRAAADGVRILQKPVDPQLLLATMGELLAPIARELGIELTEQIPRVRLGG